MSNITPTNWTSSNLSQTDNSGKELYPGFDFVVSVFESSVSATMKHLLQKISNNQKITLFYKYTDNNYSTLQAYDYQKFLTENHIDFDPFSLNVSAGGQPVKNSSPGGSTSKWNKLFKNLFGVAIQFSIGKPSGGFKKEIVEFKDNQDVHLNLFFSEFEILELQPGVTHSTFFKYSQTSSNPYIFTVDVKTTQIDALENGGTASIPQAVKTKLQSLGQENFSVQRLLFDLLNAQPVSEAQIEGVPSGSKAQSVLNNHFTHDYLKHINQHGGLVLGYTIQKKSTAHIPDPSLTATDIIHRTAVGLDDSGSVIPQSTIDSDTSKNLKYLPTFNYICAVNNNHLANNVAVKWNWLNPNNAIDNANDGVIAVKRAFFAKAIAKTLIPHLKKLCFQPQVQLEYQSENDNGGGYGAYDGSFDLKDESTSNPTIKIEVPCANPPTTDTVAKVYYTSTASKIAHQCKLQIDYTAEIFVKFKGTKITIEQQVKAKFYWGYVHSDGTWTTPESGSTNPTIKNLIDKTHTDIYSLEVSNGEVAVGTPNSSNQDNSQQYKPDWLDRMAGQGFTADLNSVAKAKERVIATNMTAIPVKTLKSFVFPGGQAFSFNHVAFSDYGDLVSHIKYLQV